MNLHLLNVNEATTLEELAAAVEHVAVTTHRNILSGFSRSVVYMLCHVCSQAEPMEWSISGDNENEYITFGGITHTNPNVFWILVHCGLLGVNHYTFHVNRYVKELVVSYLVRNEVS